MEYILIMIGILIICLIILGISKLMHYLIKKKFKVQSIFMILMTIVWLPILTILIYQEIGNYWSSPTQEDSKRLGEMVAKTIHSQDYKKIAQKETIYAIEPSMSRFKRPKDSYIYEINVYTDKNAYMFSCDENTWVKVPKCKNISIGQWGGAFDYSDDHTFFKGYNGYRNGKAQ